MIRMKWPSSPPDIYRYRPCFHAFVATILQLVQNKIDNKRWKYEFSFICLFVNILFFFFKSRCAQTWVQPSIWNQVLEDNIPRDYKMSLILKICVLLKLWNSLPTTGGTKIRVYRLFRSMFSVSSLYFSKHVPWDDYKSERLFRRQVQSTVFIFFPTLFSLCLTYWRQFRRDDCQRQ
jgi:hypothetical protein